MKHANKIIDFFGNVLRDHRMSPAHLSLYVSLFQLWSMHEYQTPFLISRKEVMTLGKIKSFGTYHKCINELHEAGFINYSPSYNPTIRSSIEIIDFERIDSGKNKIVHNKRKVSMKQDYFSVPMRGEVELYFNERNLLSGLADQFYSLYHSNNWKLLNHQPMKCWKSAARCWIYKFKNANQH